MNRKKDLNMKEPIRFPDPTYDGERSLEWALLRRRSARRYLRESLSLREVGQILWAAQGCNSARGFSTAPSAGATFPLKTFLAAGDVEQLTPGLYRYLRQEHALSAMRTGDLRQELCRAALGQGWVRDGAAVIIFAAIYVRTTGRYGKRGFRYVHMEAGHAQQNVHLQAAALGIGTVVVGAFEDRQVKRTVGMKAEEEPLSIMPLGRIRAEVV
jgi:SagB-type dehydrogenase family enzyme